MQHIGSGNTFYMSRFNKGETPDSLIPPKVFDKETTQKYLTETFDFCAGLIRNLNDADLDKAFPGRPNTPSMTGWDWLLNASSTRHIIADTPRCI